MSYLHVSHSEVSRKYASITRVPRTQPTHTCTQIQTQQKRTGVPFRCMHRVCKRVSENICRIHARRIYPKVGGAPVPHWARGNGRYIYVDLGSNINRAKQLTNINWFNNDMLLICWNVCKRSTDRSWFWSESVWGNRIIEWPMFVSSVKSVG